SPLVQAAITLCSQRAAQPEPTSSARAQAFCESGVQLVGQAPAEPAAMAVSQCSSTATKPSPQATLPPASDPMSILAASLPPSASPASTPQLAAASNALAPASKPGAPPSQPRPPSNRPAPASLRSSNRSSAASWMFPQ